MFTFTSSSDHTGSLCPINVQPEFLVPIYALALVNVRELLEEEIRQWLASYAVGWFVNLEEDGDEGCERGYGPRRVQTDVGCR